MSLPPFPNPERILAADLGVLLGDPARAGGSTPDDLQEHLPFVTVRRIGGPSDNVNDYPFVNVEVTALTLAEATQVAEDVRARLVSEHIRNEHGQIDRTLCTSAHTEIPAPDPNLRRITTTYRCTLRRLPIAV